MGFPLLLYRSGVTIEKLVPCWIISYCQVSETFLINNFFLWSIVITIWDRSNPTSFYNEVISIVPLICKSNIKKEFYGLFLWMGFNCLKARATSRRQATFYTKFPEVPGTHFIDLGRMKGWLNLGATQRF